jgi:hypothetical protein
MDVSAGYNHACAVRTTGQLACWGDNAFGKATPPSGTYGSVECGQNHTCALRNDGSVVCFGANGSGQSNAPSGPFVELAAHGDSACALRSNGSVECWGGLPSPPGLFSTMTTGCGVRSDGTLACWWPTSGASSVPPLGTFRSVEAGNGYYCAIGTDYSLRCFGWIAR